MTLDELKAEFAHTQGWEARYRLLIQLSRKLPKPSPERLAQLPEIPGCESRLWFEFKPETQQIEAYSEARLMQGLLFILLTAAQNEFEKDEPFADFDLLALLDELQISRHLTQTKLNGLNEIYRQLSQTASRKVA